MTFSWNGFKIFRPSVSDGCSAKQILHISQYYQNRTCLTSSLCLFVLPGDRPRKLYAERALNLPLGAELITGNMWYCCYIFIPCSSHAPLHHLFIKLSLLTIFSCFFLLFFPLHVVLNCFQELILKSSYLCVYLLNHNFWLYNQAYSTYSQPPLCLCVISDLLSTSSNSECQDGLVGGHSDCPFQRRIIPAHRLRPRRTHPEIFQVSIAFIHFYFLLCKTEASVIYSMTRFSFKCCGTLNK